MWITRKTYEDLVANNNNLKRINLSLMQEKNELYKENFEMAKELEQLKSKKTRKTSKKKDETIIVGTPFFAETETKKTRKPRTKKEDK